MTLEKWLKEEVEEKLQKGLFVWYDPLASFEPVVEKVVPRGAKLLKFEGSYLDLRFKLEDEDPDFDKNWVVYIPEKATNFLRDWEFIGSKEVLSLPEVLLRKGKLSLNIELRKALEKNSSKLVRNWNILIGKKKPTAELIIDSLLAIAFELSRWDEEEAVIKFIVKPEEIASELKEAEIYNFWLERLSEFVEIEYEHEHEDAKEVRDKLLKTLLFGELVYKGRQSRDIFTLLPKPEKIQIVSSILRRWRNDARFKESYIAAVDEVERAINIKEHLQLKEALFSAETFPEIDDVILEELLSSTNPENYNEKVDSIEKTAERRVETFWAKNMRVKYWKPVLIASKLFKGCKEALKEYERMNRDELIDKYVSSWWRLDRMALELSTYDSGRESPLITPAHTAYGTYLDRVNRRLQEAVKKEGWNQNLSSFWSYVARAEKPVAVFFTDALRFDLAKMLVEELGVGVEEVKVEWLLGVLPSITEIGMAALLPDAQLSLAYDHSLKVSIGNQSVTDKSERVAYLKEREISVIDFDSRNIPKADVLVVMTREIDRLGEIVNIAPQNLIEILDKVSTRILKLREFGFRSVVLGGDHGFLYLMKEPERVPCKGEVVKWRFAINTSEGNFVAKSEDVGINGDLLLGFPAGTSIFAVQGGTPEFVHGGLSLQEAIVPVVTSKLAKPKEKVKVGVEYPEPVTSRIVLIKLKTSFERLDVESRRVYVEVNNKKSDVITIVPGKAERVRLSWLSEFDEAPEEVEIRVVDYDSGEVMSKRKAKVSLLL
jgi:hypothetical protein